MYYISDDVIYIYLIANIVFFFTLRKQQISIKNIFVYVYWGLMLLYPMAVYSVYALDITDYVSSQMFNHLSDEHIVNEVLKTASIALFTFAICMILKPISKEDNNRLVAYSIKGYKLLYFLMLPFALYLSTTTNWTSDREGVLPSLAAYSRNIMTVLTIVMIVPNNVKTREKFIYLFLFMLLTFFSTQRTNALIVIVALIYTLKSGKTALKFAVGGVLAIVVLGSVRNGVSASNILYPIMGEGLFGSWGFLQAIDVTQYEGYSWGQFFMLFNATLNWIFSFLHLPLELSTYGTIIEEAGEVYYPMGGFFYLSDAYLMHPILGPILYTILIYWIYKKSIDAYYKYHTPLSLICVSLLFDAVKGSLYVFFVILLFHALFYFIAKTIAGRCNKKIAKVEF
ncbi:hypothetical protein [Bacteroides helcogenes]|uniref:Uncharacterized protein n=1 Tax=Bacteroides helcogenes (strain ATCC 35417 / DSM 20613 / JCM 6297 / CCUG 15421 / P 36-108) TaxID=693979 RepID=E6SPD6_BACT6|nr:hypothetical protein [Bacteroides helcogenes]ADV44893.1 hypothetical protein Bache_2959 [Bacteroides helcogenes P 36-108]MDY5239749.1 hypothetical protein [Bacteroides helcogenes]